MHADAHNTVALAYARKHSAQCLALDALKLKSFGALSSVQDSIQEEHARVEAATDVTYVVKCTLQSKREKEGGGSAGSHKRYNREESATLNYRTQEHVRR